MLLRNWFKKTGVKAHLHTRRPYPLWVQGNSFHRRLLGSDSAEAPGTCWYFCFCCQQHSRRCRDAASTAERQRVRRRVQFLLKCTRCESHGCVETNCSKKTTREKTASSDWFAVALFSPASFSVVVFLIFYSWLSYFQSVLFNWKDC